LDRPAYIRVRRGGNFLYYGWSSDGVNWMVTPLVVGFPELPHKLKVGVVAEVTAEGTFEAEFDHFKLTPLTAADRE
jgi:hypothetical protein